MHGSPTRLLVVFAVVVATSVVGVTAPVGGRAVAGPPGRPRLPDVLGLSLASARARIALAAEPVRVKVITATVKSVVPRGRVVAQTPVIGTHLTSGTRVTLIVSGGTRR